MHGFPGPPRRFHNMGQAGIGTEDHPRVLRGAMHPLLLLLTWSAVPTGQARPRSASGSLVRSAARALPSTRLSAGQSARPVTRRAFLPSIRRMGPIGARVEAALPQLRELFRSRGVVLGYLFGSVAGGRERADSDLDMAVLLGPGTSPDRYFDVTVELNTAIIGLTHTDEVDVVILNRAPPALAFEVVSTGRLLHGGHEERVEYEVQAVKRFIDTEPIRRLQRQAFSARIDALADSLGEGKGRW